ncbi:porin family protein [Maribellus sediminis]|uniref:porin family protein n=1 Tax=Maribellus sediminis TaxID=2696285 RepID=UPI00142F71C8|nr:porin family protein [Maribellus sediminis]
MKQKTEQNQVNPIKLTRQKVVLTFALLSLFGLGTSQLAQAQTEFGVRIFDGASTQSQLFNLFDNNDLKASYGVGVSGKYNFSEGLALQTGLEYFMKGGKPTFNENQLNTSSQYLEIPLQLEFSAGEKVGFNEGQKLFFAAGPYLAYLLDAERKSGDLTSDISDDASKTDFGLRFTSGISFPVFKRNAIQVSMNYDMGLSEVYKNTNDVQNKAGFISVGYVF